MTPEEFRKNGHRAIEWVADYLEQIEKYPVKSQVSPGDILAQIPKHPPQKPDQFDQLIEDLDQQILPGITHWQHPNFHAYFSGNSSYPSVLAELITSGIGAQCMIWETSPAAAELEERMLQWLAEMTGLPENWHGVIQDTASTATLASLLTAREQKTNYATNARGFSTEKLRFYCSSQTHSSIDKAVKILGAGIDNLIKIDVDDQFAMLPDLLEKQIQEDLKKGYVPCAVVSTLGTTGTLAFDPVAHIADVAHKYNVWHHVDAAYAGSAMVLDEYRHHLNGLELADTYVFNPHKWLFTNFDCSAYYVKDKAALLRTFEILPEYLKTKTHGAVNDYRDWGIPLGRRFRALKLWFVIRDYGVDGIRQRVREHISYGEWLEAKILEHSDFEIMAPRTMNLVVFRYKNGNSLQEINQLNSRLLERINSSGQAYITHTKIGEAYVLRLVTGQTRLEMKHMKQVWQLILDQSRNLD